MTVTPVDLANKKILITGGVDGDNHLLGQALFNPAMIWTDKDDYQRVNRSYSAVPDGKRTNRFTYLRLITRRSNGRMR